MKNRKLWLLNFAIIFIFCFVYWRSDGFSGHLIGAVLVKNHLSPHYRYLAKGKQCFVFQSEDGKTVLKFFNRSYFKEPFYLPFLPSKWAAAEKRKRSHRSQSGYELAFSELGEQILNTKGQSIVYLTDRLGRHYSIDLSKIPFVEQRKGNLFYPTLQQIYANEGESGLNREIGHFIDHIARRISKNIADRDHNVEDNWGYVDGVLFHLDPGRIYRDGSLTEPQRLEKEWWSATHRFRKWLEINYPASVAVLDEKIQKELNAFYERIDGGG